MHENSEKVSMTKKKNLSYCQMKGRIIIEICIHWKIDLFEMIFDWNTPTDVDWRLSLVILVSRLDYSIVLVVWLENNWSYITRFDSEDEQYEVIYVELRFDVILPLIIWIC